MTSPLPRASTPRTETNPAMLFQAPRTPETGPASFEAALDRARQPERTPEKPASTTRQPDAERPRSRNEHSELPREGSPSTPQEKTAKQGEVQTGHNQAGEESAAEEESPAAVPAEIAALLAALAAGTRAVQTPDDAPAENVDADAQPLLPSLGARNTAKNSNLSAQGQHAAAAQAKPDAPVTETPLRAAPTAVADPLLHSASDETTGEGQHTAKNPAQALGPMFAARTEHVRAPGQAVQLPVASPPGTRAWANDVGNQVVWMLGRNESKAELILTPSSLGKLGVSIQMNGEQTSAHFVAATPAAREALEQAMPRLREMLQQAGIQLGQADVSTSGDQAARDGSSDGRGRSAQRGTDVDDGMAGAGTIATSAVHVRSGDGVIDTFA